MALYRVKSPKMAKKHYSNYKNRSSWLYFSSIVLIVALSGLFLAMSSLGRWLEEEVSLAWLFKTRGEIAASPHVAVVSIDQSSSQYLNLPNKPRKWPRNLHGELVEQLTRHGATAIGFDIIFEEQRNPADNKIFAKGLRFANNVVLFQYLKQEIISLGDQGEAKIEKLISPIPILADNTLGLSPFPLPKVPAKVNHFLLFKPELGNTPTLPVTMLQIHGLSVYQELLSLLEKYHPTEAAILPQSEQSIRQRGNIQMVVKDIRAIFLANPNLGEQLHDEISQSTLFSEKQKYLLRGLVETYQSPRSLYLNFYGSPRTISTIAYHEVLNSDPNNPTIDVKGKAIFVGFSEQFQPEQKDGFFTVYTQDKNGLDISGVEVIATAFANLLQRSALIVPSPGTDVLIIIFWSLGLGLIFRFIPGAWLIPTAVVCGAAYSLTAYYAFVDYYYWLPTAVPILWQLPLIAILIFLWKYLEVQKERRNIRRAFGYHLPSNIIDELAHGFEQFNQQGEITYGVVMASDAEQYTTLSEQLNPKTLRDLMNDYYEVMFEPIRAHDGNVSDVVGDATLAVWSNPKDNTNLHQQACLAVLKLQNAIAKFNQQHAQYPLPTRIGLHCGEVILGHIGALDHYEYRATGDTVNTASRIEGFNKTLGTYSLVSQAVVDQISDIYTRELGTFVLVGKQTPIVLHELIGLDAQLEPKFINYMEVFAQGLAAFRSQQWHEAESYFQQVLSQYPDDGPSHYYRKLCHEYTTNAPADFDGIVYVATK